MAEKRMSIHQALAEMEELNEFSFSFVRASGKNRGSIKEVKRARKGGRKGAKAGSAVGKANTHIRSGTIPVTDINAKQYITPKISHIITFNRYKVIH